MSFDFSNINPINKAQAAYKDGGGLGGGGMYMKQGKRHKKEEETDDLFEYKQDSNELDLELDSELKEDEIPQDTLINKFVNWFRIGKK